MFLRDSQQRGVLRNWMKRTGLHQVNLQLQIIESNNKHHELNLTLGLDSLFSRAFQLTLSISPTTLPCAQAAALLFGSYLKFLLVHLLQAYSFITSIFIHYKHTSLSIVIKVALKSLSANFNIWKKRTSLEEFQTFMGFFLKERPQWKIKLRSPQSLAKKIIHGE